jgi:predicted  nucleic acid-binding Zn-ribbon protein
MAFDELEERVSALEKEVRDLSGRVRGTEQDAAAARVLAGGADRDVSEIRTEIVDLRGHVDRGFAEVRGKLDAAAAGQQQIVGLIQTLVDDRRHN